MGSRDEVISSGERLSFFKLFSEKGFKVEIPIIQRDYAQGRASEHEVRKVFLNALYGYLEEGRPNRDLDFVYGSLFDDEGKQKFVPLDGQQRLTTLFLLHWYLAQISDNSESFRQVMVQNNRSQFTYETRASSSEFCDALMASEIDLAALSSKGSGGINTLSGLICDSGWFYLSWGYDPTIQSMLTMLDAIHKRFAYNPEFYHKLVDTENPVITFLFLNFRTFGLTDDLYIKMNARGKPLTDFENFKAKFEQKIKSLGNKTPTHRLRFTEKLVGDYEYFIHKIDTDWADIFWAYRKGSSKEGSFDEELMAFIGLVIANYRLLEGSKSAGVSQLFGPGGMVKSLSFQEYSDLGCFTTGLVEHLIKIMDALYQGGLVEGHLKCYLKDDDYYSEEKVFQSVISNMTSYPEKLRFYSFYIYLLKAQDEVGLIDWLRVIYNLTENTIINTADEYRRMLLSIAKLSDKCESMLDALKDDCEVTAFSGAQVIEEKIKASLILKSAEWSGHIIDLEKHPFFKGQIGFALNFSGVLGFYREHGDCHWDSEADNEYMSAFKKYAEVGSKIFYEIRSSSSCIDYLWERAVLSKGIYFTENTADRWNMLSARVVKNNIERDHSWKRLLRISTRPDPYWDCRQGFVKAVFDDPSFDVNDIESSLKLICDAATRNKSLEEWRRLFIQHPALFKECNQGFIVRDRDSGQIYLLNESQRNHYHSELFTLVLSWKMKGGQFKPFYFGEYGYVKSRDLGPYVDFDTWVYGGVNYQLSIKYSPGEYRVYFDTESSEGYPDSLITFLECSNMEQSDSSQVSPYSHSCNTTEEVSEFVDDFCAGIRSISDE